jgi:hypothetical protein
VQRIQVVTQPQGGTLIAWEMRPQFKAKGPFHFYVDFGRSGTHGEWETLNQLPIVDDCVYMDVKQRGFDHLADFYYRVRLVLPNEIDPETGKCKFCISEPQQANGVWSKRDWLYAREIARKERLMQRKRTNLTAVGFILKRRRWGQPCNVCREYDTDEVQAQCNVCFGTGFVGGFFKAVDFTVTMDAPWSRDFKRNEMVAVTNNISRWGRAVAYPYLDTNDLFVRRDSGERFYVNEIKQIVEVGNIPVVVAVELRLAPTTDQAYQVPIYGGSSSAVPPEPGPPPCPAPPSSSSSSSEKKDDCDYRRGVESDKDW